MEEDRGELNIFDLQGVRDIRRRPDILSKIKLDITPEMVMEPRFQSRSEDLRKLRDISGYMFYIETQAEPPALMLMRVGKSDITSTVGKIDEIPSELVRRAIEKPEHKPTHGMYAITEEIKEWLRRELNL